MSLAFLLRLKNIIGSGVRNYFRRNLRKSLPKGKVLTKISPVCRNGKTVNDKIASGKIPSRRFWS